ncbi:MAG: hypothetical protein JXA78_05640 [Anaerolineales bacterium]|nr:hypothetical protein [Anaerolineales bacterium]
MEKEQRPQPRPDRRAFLAVFTLLLFGLLTAYYLWGMRRIPFHPDESTQLFMSADFEALLHNPSSLFWSAEKRDDPRQILHERDAPLTRYLLGAGRSLAGLEAPPVDWDWGKSWEQNRQAGALPNQRLLMVGRATITLLLPFSLLFIYLSGAAIGGRFTGLLAALLLGVNALILLHARRAMAEGALTLGITFALWSFLQADKRPWLAGLGMALAFNAKQSALALLPVGLLAVCWILPEGPVRANTSRSVMTRRAVRIASACVQYMGVFVLLTLMLNPFLWSNSTEALQASWTNRQDLIQRQVADVARLAPEQLLDSPSQRAAALLTNLYLAPPSFAEVGNYLSQTAGAQEIYLDTPGHNLMRNLIGGAALLVLTLFGMLIAALQARSARPERRRALILSLVATLAQASAVILIIPLPWQRYVIPLVPFTCLWSGYSIGHKLTSKGQSQ